MIYAKAICLFFAIMFTIVNVLKVRRYYDVPAMNFILQAAGITGFIVLQFLLGD